MRAEREAADHRDEEREREPGGGSGTDAVKRGACDGAGRCAPLVSKPTSAER